MEIWLVITWAIITVVLTTAELLTTQLVAIWFAAGSLAAFVSALLGASFNFTLIIFVGVSVLLLILTRPIAKKLLKTKAVPTNADAIINETAIVCEKIDNLSDSGRIYINGLNWLAKSFDESVILEEGQKCTIAEIKGVTAIVKPLN